MKIQLKRSNQLDGGAAKEPSQQYMEYGELAVNFNEADPAIFLKDSDDNIVRIAGANAEGVNDVIVSDTPPNTADLVEGQLWWNSDSTSGKLFVLYNDPSGGGGTDAGGLKWVETSPTPEIPSIFPDLDDGNNQPGTLDDRYLSTEASAGNQTVESTGTTKFNGLVDAGGGVKVSGGDSSAISSGLHYNSEANVLAINVDGALNTSISRQYGVDSKQPLLTHDYASKFIGVVQTNAGNRVNNMNVYNTNFQGDAGLIGNLTAFNADRALSEFGDVVKGFESNIYPVDGVTGYNFFSGEEAPNFFRGDTYVGGTTSRSTFELWKSTLTEEQLEQYEAGTLAVPANVSTPGNGEFARQWWYNQQDAETQALLDSGELDYPEHLAAATFTDTFDLDTTTRIKLDGTSGLGTFKGGVSVTGGVGSISSGIAGLSSNNQLQFYTNSTNHFSINRYGGLFANSDVDLETQSQFTRLLCAGNITGGVNNIELKGVDVNFKYTPSVGYTASEVYGFNCSDLNIEAANLSGKLIGYHSQIMVGGRNAFNFYAAGNAPNYFRGRLWITNADNANADLVNGPGDYDGTNQPSTVMHDRGIMQAYITDASTTSSLLRLNRLATLTANAEYISCHVGGNKVGGLGTNGAGEVATFQTSDYRLKSNIAPMSSAVDLIKNLKPCTYTKNNIDNIQGFIAHELQESIPHAVMGAKDATEAIGTLYDFDGTVLETEVTEPPVEAQSYVTEEGETRVKSWIETGNRPVYQGVDQTKLIPLLTKALQEALTRIEELESNTLQPLYSTVADLPNASDHHGKTAHVHSEGALYFAHAGSWVKLQNA